MRYFGSAALVHHQQSASWRNPVTVEILTCQDKNNRKGEKVGVVQSPLGESHSDLTPGVSPSGSAAFQ